MSPAAKYLYQAIKQRLLDGQVTAASGDTIRIAANVSAAAGRIDRTTIGDSVTLKAINATEWVATSVVGAGWSVT